MYGVLFPRGVAVSIDGNAMLERKLPGHPEFALVIDVEAKVTESSGEPDAQDIAGMSKAELKAALDAAGIAYPSNANKATLAALLAEAE